MQKSRRSPSYAIASAETAEVEAEHVEENVEEKVAEGEAAAADPTEARTSVALERGKAARATAEGTFDALARRYRGTQTKICLFSNSTYF